MSEASIRTLALAVAANLTAMLLYRWITGGR